MEQILCYPFRIKTNITCDWKEKVEFPVGSGKMIDHSGQDTSNIPLHEMAKREKNDDYLDILAMTLGEVKEVKRWGTKGSLGYGIQIYYPFENVTKLTLHIKKPLVKKGDKVKLGQVIGVVGMADGQTIDEHTHEQYEEGDRLSTGLMSSHTQNPYIYTKRMKLLSQINTEPTINIPESVYQALLKKEMEDATAITACNNLVVLKNASITDLEGKLNAEQQLTHTMEQDANSVISMLLVDAFGKDKAKEVFDKYKYDVTVSWDKQKDKYNELIEIIHNNRLDSSSIGQLLGAILRRFAVFSGKK